MVRSGSSPGPGDVATVSDPLDRRAVSALAWLVPPVAVVVVTAAAVDSVNSAARVPVAWAGGAAAAVVLALCVELYRRGRALARMRALADRRAAELTQELTQRQATQKAEAEQLAGMLPLAMSRMIEGENPEEIVRRLSEQAAEGDPGLQAVYKVVLRAVLRAVKDETDLRDSAQHAFVNVARRVQAIVHQQAVDLREMEDRHGRNPEVFGDLLRIDHGTALVGRLADSIAVLGGARPGRQWQRDIPLYSVLRGSMSRILDYQRVDLHSVAEVAIKGATVEPLIHVLAELLDNATRYSPPQTRVHLTALEVQAGVAIEIEDGGVGLSDEAQARAERVLEQAGSTGFDISDLGETPRLGLSVVGRLAAVHGFQISLRPSAYAGVRAVIVVPQRHVVPVKPERRGPMDAQAIEPPRQEQKIYQSPLPRTPLDETPDAEPSVLQAAMQEHRTPQQRYPQAPQQSQPPRGPQPQPQQSPMVGLLDEQPLEPYTRNANGLPQRRRHSFGVNPYGLSAAAYGQRGPAAGEDAPAKSAADDVEPGLWLAAFTEGISGGSSAANGTAGTTGTTGTSADSDEGEGAPS